MKRSLYLLGAALALAASQAHAAPITLGQSVTSASAGALFPDGPGAYSGNLVNEPGLAYSNTYLLDLSQYNAREVSVQTVFSTVTYVSPTVTDGSKSTGSVTVLSYAALSTAAATIQVSVTNNFFGATAPVLTFANCSLTMGLDYSRGATKLATAQNLATAITACNSSIAAAAASNAVIYATATVGSYANSYAFTSNNSSITVSAAKMSGGADNACLTINGTAICANKQFSAVTSNAQTATNIAAAIHTAIPTLNTIGSAAVVYATSTLNGAVYNYTLVSSSPTALSVSGAALTGGADSGFTLNGKKIVANASGMTLGLPFLYAIGANPAIGGLTTGTTYFAVPAGGTSFFFAKYSSSAVAGFSSDYATVTSTNSGTTAHTYTLAPVAWTNSATYIWQTSNDATNWSTAPSTGTVTITNASTGSPLSTNFGVLGYRYLRLNFAAPTFGGMAFQVPVYLKQD